MERFVKDPHTLRQKRLGPLCPQIDEFAQHRKGLVAAPVTLVERTTIDKLLDDFSLYLQQERVLAPTTVANYVSLIKKFLTHRFGTGPADLSDLTAAQVVGSVQRLVPSLCRKRAKVMTSALRSFLRYARYQDFIRSDLAACVPCVADWSVASIPKGLPIEHVKRVLASCNRKSAIGRRDYAILLLLARLGLRAGEVYKSRRDQYLKGQPTSDFFFVTKRGTRLDKNNVRGTFHALSRQIGLRGEFDSHGPRLHDFRHRFAIQTLLRWYRSGDDVERRLPVLSTYLGHVRPDDTYWYLTACPELMGQAVERLERRWRTPK